MRVPEYHRVKRSETGPIPKWAEITFEQMERQIETLTNAIMRIDFAANFLGDVKVVKLIHGIPATIRLSKLTIAPTGAFVLAAQGQTVTGFRWWRIDQKNVGVSVLFDGAPSDPVDVTIGIFGESG